MLSITLIASVQRFVAGISRYAIAALALFTAAYPFASGRIQNVHPTLPDGFQWPTEKHLYLYGPNADERSTLTLLIPYLNDSQTCTILESTEQIKL